MKTISIEYAQAADLIAFQNNSRAHSDAQIAQVAASISQFGFINPIVVDHASVVVAGHARLSAAKKLGLISVPTVRVDHLSEAEVRLYRIADNKLAENATWDERALRLELEYLSEIDIDISLSGFELPEIDALLADTSLDEERPPEALPAPPENPVVQEGDIFLLGRHRIVCGDCRNSETMSRLMEGATASVVVTDPPFNVRVNGHVLTGKSSHAEFAMASGEMSPDEFTAFLIDGFAQFREHSVDGSLHYLFMDWRHAGEMLQAGDHVYDGLLNICVWAKTNAGMGSLYRSQHEFIFVFKNGKASHLNNVQLGKFGRNRSNVWAYAGMNTFGKERDEALALHPTVKPTAMIADAILDASNRGDVVLDGFLGSGTTLLAAEQTGRVAYGCEIDPRYVEVAIERFRKVSGAPVNHEESGMDFDDLKAERSVGVPRDE
ncbi:ParB N-terminal domain-containing protein [bacterium SCSIO 12827]|nr:ParB N-terminal domain-containing protein [bacterium SCSIO 12827]